ncbi:c-type cytochrome [Loktanella sp. M215]|uniref:c-type cytochrome n=1 Tax=Loktanella sp. M215 TaxID=2675431 RepID=UPI001F3D1964|nr:cytochrome c [Loktanella sp. M215]MCF7699210.1 c-type cytochrome [Loktanella sp. M215]
MKRSLIAGIGVAAAGAIWFVTADRTAQAETITLRPDDAGIVATGAEIYATTCASCHGAALEGQPNWKSRNADGRLPAPPHDASGHTWHHDSATLFTLTKLGVAEMIGDPAYQSDMPAYAGTLTDDQIIAVLSYIKSTWPQTIRDSHDMRDQPS